MARRKFKYKKRPAAKRIVFVKAHSVRKFGRKFDRAKLTDRNGGGRFVTRGSRQLQMLGRGRRK